MDLAITYFNAVTVNICATVYAVLMSPDDRVRMSPLIMQVLYYLIASSSTS